MPIELIQRYQIFLPKLIFIICIEVTCSDNFVVDDRIQYLNGIDIIFIWHDTEIKFPVVLTIGRHLFGVPCSICRTSIEMQLHSFQGTFNAWHDSIRLISDSA